MKTTFIVFLLIFILGSIVIVFSLKNGTYKYNTQTLLVRATYGFLKGFILSFIIISIFVATLVYGKGFNNGTLFDFILWNSLISFFVALMNSIVMAVGVDINHAKGIYKNFYAQRIKALGIVSTVFSGFVILAFLIIFTIK